MVQLLLHRMEEKTSRVSFHLLTIFPPCVSSQPTQLTEGTTPDLGLAAGCVSGKSFETDCRDCSPPNSTTYRSGMAPPEGVTHDPAWRQSQGTLSSGMVTAT